MNLQRIIEKSPHIRWEVLKILSREEMFNLLLVGNIFLVKKKYLIKI